MIQGVAIRRARTRRTTKASRIAPERKSGTARERSPTTRSNREAPNSLRLTRDSVAKADLAGPRSDVRELRVILVDANFVGRLGHVPDNGIAHRRATADLLERLHVEVGDMAEVVLGPRRFRRGLPHAAAKPVVPREQIEHARQRLDLQLVD